MYTSWDTLFHMLIVFGWQAAIPLTLTSDGTNIRPTMLFDPKIYGCHWNFTYIPPAMSGTSCTIMRLMCGSEVTWSSVMTPDVTWPWPIYLASTKITILGVLCQFVRKPFVILILLQWSDIRQVAMKFPMIPKLAPKICLFLIWWSKTCNDRENWIFHLQMIK